MPKPPSDAGTDVAGSSSGLARQQIQVLKITEGFHDSQILFALNELGVFATLQNGPRLLARLAAETGASEDGLERLLAAGVAQGLVALVDGTYANSELASAVLVAGRTGYLGNWLRFQSRYFKIWAGLKDAVLSGEPVADPMTFLGDDPEATREFVMAMDDYARLRGSEVVHHLDLAEASRVLDLGGGSGAYSILFAQRWPHLRITIFDLPGVLRIAAENCEAAGVTDRVDTVAGDFHRDELGDEFDVVFFSDALHQLAPADAELLLAKIDRALKPGGRLVVQGMFLGEDRVSPRWVTIVSLNMLLVYGSGRAYTVSETMGLLERAGFKDLEHRRMSLVGVNSLVIGYKP